MSWFTSLVNRLRSHTSSKKNTKTAAETSPRRPSSAPLPSSPTSLNTRPSTSASERRDQIYGLRKDNQRPGQVPKVNGSVFSPRPSVTARKHISLTDRAPSPTVELEDDALKPFNVPSLSRAMSAKRGPSKLRRQVSPVENEGWTAKRGPSLSAMRSLPHEKAEEDLHEEFVKDGESSPIVGPNGPTDGRTDSGIDISQKEKEKRRGSQHLSHEMLHRDARERMKEFFKNEAVANPQKDETRRNTLPTQFVFDANHNLVEVPAEETQSQQQDHSTIKSNGSAVKNTASTKEVIPDDSSETGDTMPAPPEIPQASTKRRRGSQSSIAFLS